MWERGSKCFRGEAPAERRAVFADITLISSGAQESFLWLDEIESIHVPEMLQAHVGGAYAGAKQPESSVLLRGQRDRGPQE